MENNLSSKGSILVTGGASGIGHAIVKKLAATGFNIVLTYNSSSGGVEKLRNEFADKHPNQTIETIKVDLAKPEQVTALSKTLADKDAFYGFVHNAGCSYDMLAALLDQDQAEHLMQINFWSMTKIVKAIVRQMQAARTGRIIGIGSITAFRGVTGNTSYAASKGAMMSYIRTLAIEIARRGVTANYIAPGFVDTDLLEPYREYHDRMKAQIPLKRFARPEEIADLVDFLMSPSAAYMTGSIIPIDGGLDAGIAVQR